MSTLEQAFGEALDAATQANEERFAAACAEALAIEQAEMDRFRADEARRTAEQRAADERYTAEMARLQAQLAEARAKLPPEAQQP